MNTTTTTTTIDRHLTLAIEDLAATGRSTAAERTLRIAREELDQLSAPSARPLPCPCALGGLWRGVPAGQAPARRALRAAGTADALIPPTSDLQIELVLPVRP